MAWLWAYSQAKYTAEEYSVEQE